MTVPPVRPDEILTMVRMLAEIGYRDLAKDANAQRLGVARRLANDGVGPEALELLWRYANASDTMGSPGRLFAYWMALPSRTLAKIDEMRQKNVWLRKAYDHLQSQQPAQEQPGAIYDMRSRRRIE